jgi:hypothetical protein
MLVTNIKIRIQIMSKKQTAVEWVFDNMANVAAGISNLTSHEILEQGLAMQKEQIVNTALDSGSFITREEAEQYYNATYGGKQ